MEGWDGIGSTRSLQHDIKKAWPAMILAWTPVAHRRRILIASQGAVLTRIRSKIKRGRAELAVREREQERVRSLICAIKGDNIQVRYEDAEVIPGGGLRTVDEESS